MGDYGMIPYVRIDSQAEEEIDVLADIFREVSLGGKYIGGHYVEKLEHELATYLNVPAVVTLNSGTDALMFALVAAGVKRGDEVITAPNSLLHLLLRLRMLALFRCLLMLSLIKIFHQTA